MAASGTSLSELSPASVDDTQEDFDVTAGDGANDDDRELLEKHYQGPHDWRKRLKPVQSPIKAKSMESLLSSGDVKDCGTEKTYMSRPLPPWKRDLIERNKKVARLVRRESSGRSKSSAVVRRESSGRSKKSTGSESPSGVTRKKSFKNGVSSESPFTQQVVNENSGRGRRVSPANSFKNASSVRRTPSDKLLDPNDPNTKKRVERVRRARLYLLQQMGPNSFLIVGDSPEHKFKVIIGPQTCTCGKGPHCVHALFVMLRVFQVSESDPCLWSKQLKNYEVENLFRVYHDKRMLRIEAQNSRKNHKPSPDRSHAPSPVVPSESDAGSVREEDDPCPICLLEMLEGESLLKCDGCQNKLHHHCITVWFEECKRQNEALICPLCRARWKQSSIEAKVQEPVADTPQAPPNTRAPSPQHESEISRLPYAEPIPGEYIGMSSPWIEILGEDLISCLFSRNWSIRETGLKHLGREITRELLRVTGENRSGSGGMSLSNTDSMLKILECCCSVVAFIIQDPVYKVFVGCLKVIRMVFAVIPSRDYQQRNKLQTLFRPVIDSIIVKCCDGTRRTSQLSISTMMELAKGQHGELALGRDLSSPGALGLGGMAYLVRCLTEKYDDVTWQWLLGRLYIIEKLVVEFPTEFLPRQRPDGASSGSSLELMGAASTDDEERPQNYDRLLVVAEFAIKAVSNSHARISRVAKRVFLLTARYAAHLENLITEFNTRLNELDFSHKKSLKRQLDKIVEEFQLSEQIGRHLHNGSTIDKELSPIVTPTRTPTSSPRCTSPVTTVSDNHSETGSGFGKNHPIVPPNTPIRDRRRHQSGQHSRRSFQFVQEEDVENDFQKIKASKSLDNLDSVDVKPRNRLSKSPVVKKVKSRSRSNTPIRVGPVLETNLDEVIKMEEESRKLTLSRNASLETDDSAFINDEEDSSLTSDRLDLHTPQKRSSSLCPRPSLRLLSHDLETDIDSVEPDLDGMLKQRLYGSCENLLTTCTEKNVSPNTNNIVRNPHSTTALILTPKVKNLKVPKSLSLDLDSERSERRSRRSISPCAHLSELERRSGVGSSDASSGLQMQFQNSSRSKSVLPSPGSVEVSNNYSLTPLDSGQMSKSKNSLTVVSPQNSKDSRRRSVTSANQQVDRNHTANQMSQFTDDLQDYMASTPVPVNEKPVTFKSEVAMATPKHSPSHTLDKDDDDCICKEEVEKEEALALAKAMEVSSNDPPKPFVPGLTPMDTEEVITIRIQPDDCDALDRNGNPPTLYYENMHWMKGPLLGTGAFSTCYQARDVKTGTIMALKQISFCRNSKTEQENVIDTITEEIHMMAKLSHPHIVRIMGATRQGCHFNMFVEWMPGGSVSYLLGLYGKFTEDVTIHYVLQLLRGLAYLHENHILHRDLKGANLLIDSTGKRLRIGDFGAAARLATKATGAGEFQGQLLGTIAFMAPEVLRGENYGRACDVWSVGCCMIEMVTAKPPWNAHDISNHLALIFKIANSQSTPPIPEKMSPPLRDLLLRCLEPVKDQRPTAKELLIHPLFTQYMQKSW